ncbi:MAG: hypothetical protein AB1801_06755 [Chloroflexota bacterium]
MAKKRMKNRGIAPTSPSRPWWLWAVVAAAVVLVVGGLSMLLIFGGSDTSSGGTPKLVVDQTVIDEGYVKLNTPVRTSFTLRNEGDGPLRLLGEPQVQLVEGC